MTKVSNSTKFQLLLWKNWLLLWNHKFQLFAELFIPALFTLLLVVVRELVVPTKEQKQTYKPFPLTLDTAIHMMNAKAKADPSFNPPPMSLAYSPINVYLEAIVAKAAEFLKITSMKGFPDAKALEDELYRREYWAGIEFNDTLHNIEGFPEKLKFALRFPGDSRTFTQSETWQTSRLFPLLGGNFPRNHKNNEGGPVGYVEEGFLPIQHAISMAYINLAQASRAACDKSLNKTAFNEISSNIQMQRYPYPNFVHDNLLEGIRNAVSMILILAYIYPCICIARSIAFEKEKQLKEVMKIMGLPNWLHWCAWFLKSFVMLMISTIIVLALIMIHWTSGVAVLTNSDVSAVLFFLTVYIIATICFCFMLAVFFSKASTAAAATGLLWFSAYIPYLLTAQNYDTVSYAGKICLCFLSNTAMAFGTRVILGFEGTGEGLQWSNFFEQYIVDDDLTVGVTMLMMLFSAILYLLICLYVEQVMPGDFGLPKKWYFFVTPNFWCPRALRLSREENSKSPKNMRAAKEFFEPDPKGLKIGLQILNLQKRFKAKWAVQGLSLNLYEDEITVLLGHNGAGKTTTISMLTGMFPPTAGTAIINGHNIITDLKSARGSLGICPQYNVLFDDMSVANHLKFFCRLKGLKDDEIQRETKKYLKLIDLEKKAHVASKKLSGGMQRKLSVCCALCGGTKVVLLDEPSSGMDPAARRHMWNLIQGEKPGRTMLITTHFMDEADVLGDRVAIMCGGELRCHGTPFFLKKKFGSGYRLICIKRENCVVIEVTRLLQKHIKDIEPDSDLGAELAYHLPYEHTSKFEALLKELEEKSEALKINGYGIGNTSMEEVFLKVGAERYSEEDAPIRKFSIYHYRDAEAGASRDNEKPSLLSNQWQAMLLKKFLYTWRRKALFFLQISLPIFFVAATVLISRQHQLGALPAMDIDLRRYHTARIVLEVTNRVKPNTLQQKISTQYEELIDSYGDGYELVSIGEQPFSDYILESGKTRQTTINGRYLAAATIDVNIITVWLNNQPLHTAPLTVNLMHNALVRAVLGPQHSIEVTNKPLKTSEENQLNNLETGNSLGGQLASNVCFCMSFVTSLYVLFLVQETESKAKLLQFVSGVRVWIFWLTQLIWDTLTFTITIVVLVVTLGLFQEKFASEIHELMDYLFLLFVFGLAALPMTYVLSSYFVEPASGFARLSMVNVFLGVALYVLILVLSNPALNNKNIADELVWIFMIYPHFSLALGINELFTNLAINDMCKTAHVKAMSKEQRCQLVKACCEPPTPFDWERPGIGAEIFYMTIVGIVCFVILILREYRLFRDMVINFKRRIKHRPHPPKDENIDSDVAQEKWRITAMSKEQIRHQNLVLDRVTKYYDHFLAVNQISLGVKPAECFGLLGVNGAGKTTTFKILTGDEKLTFGQAYVRGFSILTNMNAVYSEIGYCPQFDALLEDLTGREVLRIFCLLRGIPKKRVKHIIEELAKAFGFMKHLDKALKKYSGGNKRKVSAALAILGNPSVIYLDEPTTGMDPAARRRLWNVICLVRDSGKSIILTSHSMEECEALCTRLAIMVNGEFKCIGSIQHLKNKFSKGFVLKIKVKTFAKEDITQDVLNAMSMPTKKEALNDGNKDIRSSIDSTSNYYTPPDFETVSEDDSAKHARLKPPPTDDLKDNLPRKSSKRSSSRDSIFVTRTKYMKYQSVVRETFVNKVKHAVEVRFPLAVLQEYYQGMLTFYVPINGATWWEIFGFMEQVKAELNVEDYAVSQTTLEEIFLEFAKQQVDLRVHSHKKGCCAFVKNK